MEIEELKLLSDQKITKFVNINFQFYLKKVIYRVVESYHGIPETIDALYLQFLYEAPRYVKRFDANKKISLRLYLGIKCRHFTANQCRHWTAKAHLVMNNFIPFPENEPQFLSDSEPVEQVVKIDFSNFEDNTDLKIFHAYFRDNKRIATIARELQMTQYRVRKVIAGIIKRVGFKES